MRMNFEEFNNEIVNRIVDYLEEIDVEKIELINVIKNNDYKMLGLLIKEKNVSICPTIYLNSYYDDYLRGKDFEEILKDIAFIRNDKHTIDNCNINDIGDITEFKNIKDKIFPKVINYDMNQKTLHNKVHMRLCDLAIIFYLDIGSTEDGLLSMIITKDIFKLWNISLEELKEIAIQNLKIKHPAKCNTIYNVIKHLICGKNLDISDNNSFDINNAYIEDNEMFVINQGDINGASIILNDEFMRQILEKFKNQNIVFIPSSIHEFLIITGDFTKNIDDIKHMISEINCNEVPKQDVLSDNCYKYTLENGLELL